MPEDLQQTGPQIHNLAIGDPDTKKSGAECANKVDGSKLIQAITASVRNPILIAESIRLETTNNDDKLKRFRDRLDSNGLTNEEYAEYRSLCMFPFDKRGQELTKKFFLHTITREERLEWTVLKNTHLPMDEDIKSLEEGKEQGDPNVKKIEMNNSNSLDFSASENQDRIIWTPSLAGCFAIAIIVEYEDGSGTISLSHYQPIEIEKNLIIQKQTSAAPIKKIKTKKALIMVAEKHEKDSESLKWKRTINKDKVDTILDTIKSTFGTDTQILVEPYLSSAHVGRERDHSLVVKRTPSGNILYQTWYDDEKAL